MRRNYGSFSINQLSAELKLSRNTVSKVLNNKSGVSDRTRALVLRHIAAAAGTETAEAAHVNPPSSPRTILFSYRLENVEYINSLFAGMEKAARECGYMLGLNIIAADARPPYFPASVCNESVCAIISFNVYDKDYCDEVLSLGLPAVFLDTRFDADGILGKADIICQDNFTSLRKGIHELYAQGKRNFGFFGDRYYCRGMHQRWATFCSTMEELKLPLRMENCILDDFSGFGEAEYQMVLRHRILSMAELPDTFICISDRQAILLLRVLKQLSIDVPGRVAILGFDNLPEATRQLPPLSTIEANSQFQGELAVRKIQERLCTPGKPHEYIECETRLILRESTGHHSHFS